MGRLPVPLFFQTYLLGLSSSGQRRVQELNVPSILQLHIPVLDWELVHWLRWVVTGPQIEMGFQFLNGFFLSGNSS